jgi:cell division protein ZapE
MQTTKPLDHYLQALAARGIEPDPSQRLALASLARLHNQITQAHIQLTKHRLKHHLNKIFGLKQHPIKGLYFWGAVGRGKTLLMDVFFEHLPFKAKQRLHFHDFMRHIHHELARLQGLKNPLSAVAKQISKEAQILCFDEFHVEDVADAMILADLLQHLFHEGVTLIFTSNTAPDSLYKNGVQRHRFLPAIGLIKQFTEVMQIDQGQDYRTQALLEAGVYFYPHSVENQHAIEKEFLQLATGDISYGHPLRIMDREIPTLAIAHQLVWFDFKSICQTYRSAEDYLLLMEQFDTFIITQVPVLEPNNDAAAKRFIHLIDVLYDHHAKLILSAAAPPDQLYQGKTLVQAFQRTQSRLIEMQGRGYLAAQ